MRLLVVEDEPRLLRSLAKALREEGYAVDTAGNGEDGLFKAENSDYDCMCSTSCFPLSTVGMFSVVCASETDAGPHAHSARRPPGPGSSARSGSRRLPGKARRSCRTPGPSRYHPPRRRPTHTLMANWGEIVVDTLSRGGPRGSAADRSRMLDSRVPCTEPRPRRFANGTL